MTDLGKRLSEHKAKKTSALAMTDTRELIEPTLLEKVRLETLSSNPEHGKVGYALHWPEWEEVFSYIDALQIENKQQAQEIAVMREENERLVLLNVADKQILIDRLVVLESEKEFHRIIIDRDLKSITALEAQVKQYDKAMRLCREILYGFEGHADKKELPEWVARSSRMGVRSIDAANRIADMGDESEN